MTRCRRARPSVREPGSRKQSRRRRTWRRLRTRWSFRQPDLPRPPRARLSRRTLLALVAGAVVVAVVVVVFASGAFGGGGALAAGRLDNAYPTAVADGDAAVALAADAGERDARLRGRGDDRRAGRDGAVEPVAGAAGGHDRRGAAADGAGRALDRTRDARPGSSASLAADRAKETVDCAGDNAAESAASASAAGRRRLRLGRRARPTRRPSRPTSRAASQDAAKVASDRQAGLLGDDGRSRARETSLDAGRRRRRPSTGRARPTRAAGGRRRSSSAAQTLYAISGEPVLLLYGPVAPWRAFAGRDVAGRRTSPS